MEKFSSPAQAVGPGIGFLKFGCAHLPPHVIQVLTISLWYVGRLYLPYPMVQMSTILAPESIAETLSQAYPPHRKAQHIILHIVDYNAPIRVIYYTALPYVTFHYSTTLRCTLLTEKHFPTT